MYARELGDQELTFGVSGKLIMNALVMYDHQTETLWSQFLSLGVDGPLTGTRLDLVAALQTDWGTWRDLHPDTTALFTGSTPNRDNYASYYNRGSAGILGEFNSDKRLGRKELVLGVAENGDTKAFPLVPLQIDGVVNDVVGGLSIVVIGDPSGKTAAAFERTVNGRGLTFTTKVTSDGGQELVDNQTGTTWEPLTGIGISGELAGTVLKRLPTTYSFWFAWTDFYPDTGLYTG